MKKYLPIIFAALLTVNAFTGCARRNSSPEQSNVSIANTSITTSELEVMPDNSFSNEDYQKLLALQLDGYEDMMISDYQSRIAKLTDSAEYIGLLEQFSKSQILYELKDTDETAAFLFYVLPLTGDEWKTQNYSGQAISSYPEDNARLEYSFSLTILDADALTIREYNITRLNVISGIQDILDGKTVEELQNANSILTSIQNDVDNLTKELQTEKIGISIEYAYFPIPTQGIDKKMSRHKVMMNWKPVDIPTEQRKIIALCLR